MQRFLILLGLVMIVIGVAWPFLAKLGLGRLPGDIMIGNGNFRLYIPLTSSLVVSVVLSLLFWLLNR